MLTGDSFNHRRQLAPTISELFERLQFHPVIKILNVQKKSQIIKSAYLNTGNNANCTVAFALKEKKNYKNKNISITKLIKLVI